MYFFYLTCLFYYSYLNRKVAYVMQSLGKYLTQWESKVFKYLKIISNTHDIKNCILMFTKMEYSYLHICHIESYLRFWSILQPYLLIVKVQHIKFWSHWDLLKIKPVSGRLQRQQNYFSCTPALCLKKKNIQFVVRYIGMYTIYQKLLSKMWTNH